LTVARFEPAARYGPGMRFSQVTAVLDALEAAEVRYWVAGGWGVALLVGEQTRTHRDLDLVVAAEDLDRCLAVLDQLDHEVETDWLPLRIELRGPDDSWVDVHPVPFDAAGHGRLVLLDGSVVPYPPDAFTTGELDGRVTPCLSAQQQRLVHSGYELQPKDRRDLAALDRLAARDR
jgi:lincosamide nucleotidyltransferase A/C/D/E